MIWFHLDFLSVVLYAAFFLGLIFRAGMFQWFWASVFLWTGVSVLGAKLLPGIWGMTHVGPLFLPHFYLTVGSAFFFIGHWHEENGKGWKADGRHILLSLFAVSNVLMTLAFAALAVLVHYLLSGTVAVFVFAAMLKLYALKPVYWFIVQGMLMAVFYVHRTVICRQTASYFSTAQLRAGMLLAMLVQTVLVVALLAEIGGV